MFQLLHLQLNNWLNVIENLKESLDIEQITLNLCFIPLVKEIHQTYDIDLKNILSNTVNPNYDIFEKFSVPLPNNIENPKDIDLIKTKKDYLLSIRNIYNVFYNKLIIPLKASHKKVRFNLQLNRKSGLTYYDDICYEIAVSFKNGKSLVLVDGGINDWISKLLSDSKEKCITSGMGLEYIGKVYKRKL